MTTYQTTSRSLLNVSNYKILKQFGTAIEIKHHHLMLKICKSSISDFLCIIQKKPQLTDRKIPPHFRAIFARSAVLIRSFRRAYKVIEMTALFLL